MDRTKLPVVIFDLDSTLADTRHRRGYLPTAATCPSDWVHYHSQCLNDPVIPGRAQLVKLLFPHHRVVILTARPDDPGVRTRTRLWLDGHEVPRDDVIFLPLDETRSPKLWKAEVVEKLRTDGAEIVLAVDDWWSNGAVLEEIGVPFLHVTPPGVGRPATP